MIKHELWRPIPGFEGYEVSSLGRVMSYRRGEPRELVGGLCDGGYRKVGLMGPDGTRLYRKVHRLVALAFLGPCPEGMEVRHYDGVALNCAVENLSYATHADNMRDLLRHGTHSNASKTHCNNGHEFAGQNLAIVGGTRRCQACHRARNQESRTRLAMAAANIQTTEVAA